jgi:hypothetical protein
LEDICTLKDARELAVNSAMASLKEIAEASTFPIFRRDKNIFVHEATCVFVQMRGSDFILTAAHALEAKGNYEIMLPERGISSLPHKMAYVRTKAPRSDRSKDKLDFAIIPVSLDWRELGVVPIVYSEAPERTDGVLVATVGFPNSQMRINRQRRRITPVCSVFLSEKQNEVNGLPVHPDTHLVATRHPKYNLEKGRKVRAISFKGKSGGPMFEIAGLNSIEVLAGISSVKIQPMAIFTEIVERGIILGTRLSYVERYLDQTEVGKLPLVSPCMS